MGLSFVGCLRIRMDLASDPTQREKGYVPQKIK